MKKIFVLLYGLITTMNVYTCNLCWGYPYTGPRLRQVPIQKLKNCNCECWKYPKTKGNNNFYICTQCEHRLTPENVSPTKKNPQYQYKRWHNAT